MSGLFEKFLQDKKQREERERIREQIAESRAADSRAADSCDRRTADSESLPPFEQPLVGGGAHTDSSTEEPSFFKQLSQTTLTPHDQQSNLLLHADSAAGTFHTLPAAGGFVEVSSPSFLSTSSSIPFASTIFFFLIIVICLSAYTFFYRRSYYYE